jgi:deoxyribodipyrimidine photolyase-related protein
LWARRCIGRVKLFGPILVARPQLVFILGDQLTPTVSSLRAADPKEAVVLMAEVGDEASYAKHHKKKLAFVFSAMRHFAAELRDLGWKVDYVRLDAPGNTHSLSGELERAVLHHGSQNVIVTEPAEWRVMEMVRSWAERLNLPVAIHPDDRFISNRDEFARWAEGRKDWRMEYFYREMRLKTGLLLDAAGGPLGGKWNFDAENRKRARPDFFMPTPPSFPPDRITEEVLRLVATRFPNNPGTLEPFSFAVTRRDAQKARDHFMKEALPRFGDFQDAMLRGEPVLYHSMLSPYLNIGLLDPLDLCWRAEAQYEAGAVRINSAEGFIRQIIGWREYVRGIYWHEMPQFRERNALNAIRPLPWFYWDGQTDMACMKEVIGQTLEYAYAHHIQRLMVTGNFALIAGIDPMQVHEWYLAVYADAYEWVELPNTVGLSQFADGGLMASKPYAAGGHYVNSMSDYCSGCRFDPRVRHGARACPMTFLYWDFLARNRERLSANPRARRMVEAWDTLDAGEQRATRAEAARFLEALGPNEAEGLIGPVLPKAEGVVAVEGL